ncbi:MAG: phosphodiester glycosidase family protein [Armatimonadota bacterium]|nr:phosphodiester glycosidase family protein [bacterium]
MRRYRSALFLLFVFVFCSAATAGPITKNLADGVTLFQDVNADPACPLITNVVRIDLANPNVHLKAAIAQDVIMGDGPNQGRETVSSITAREGALVGVNADYFPFTGDPLGTCVSDGALLSEPGLKRAVFGFLNNGRVFFDNPRFTAKLTMPSGVSRQIDGINRGRQTNQLIVYTEAFGPSTQSKYKGTDIIATSEFLPIRVGNDVNVTVTEVRQDALNTPIPKGGVVISAGGPAASFLKENVAVGDKLKIRFDIKSNCDIDWTQVDQALGGGPWLVRDGKVCVDYSDEGFERSFATNKHPRTAVGVTVDNMLLIVTVDGRQLMSAGLSLANMAEAMKTLGACQAINLDGGGSTTMSVRGTVINSPSEGTERPVADMLLVSADQPAVRELSKLKISGIGEETASGEGAQLYLTWGDDDQMLTESQMSRVIWGCTKGVGFVDQNGYFYPTKTRSGTIDAFYGAQHVSAPVSVIGGTVKELKVDAINDKYDRNKSKVTVTVFDVNGNRLAGQKVVIDITGGYADISSGTTNDNGDFTANVTWASGSDKRIVCASSDGIKTDVSVPAPK